MVVISAMFLQNYLEKDLNRDFELEDLSFEKLVQDRCLLDENLTQPK